MAEGHTAPLEQGGAPGAGTAEPGGRAGRDGREGLRAEQRLGLDPAAENGTDLLCAL